jgi:hypothetical protein
MDHIKGPFNVIFPFVLFSSFVLAVSCLTSSVLTLTAIACDRFMAVLFPLRVRITQCRAGAVIISIWAISIVVSIPFAVYRKLFEIQVSGWSLKLIGLHVPPLVGGVESRVGRIVNK